jgi:hypothetical protein
MVEVDIHVLLAGVVLLVMPEGVNQATGESVKRLLHKWFTFVGDEHGRQGSAQYRRAMNGAKTIRLQLLA